MISKGRTKYNSEYYIKNRENILKAVKQYSKENPRNCSSYLKQWYKDNCERERKKHRQYNKNNYEKLKEYRKYNIKKIRLQINKREKERKKTDLKYNLNRKMKDMIYHSLKGNKNGRHWEDLVGYILSDLIKRLKRTIPKGYTWQDYIKGKLHIDHIIPIRAFKFKKPEDKEFQECWNLYNLRLLSAEENILKKDNINPILLELILNEVV